MIEVWFSRTKTILRSMNLLKHSWQHNNCRFMLRLFSQIGSRINGPFSQ